ncbi:MAG: hypothetical protein ABIJ45_14270 [Candidatus Zixiibacteriota bacterium]
MSETPDKTWQQLIDNYLAKLNSWQRMMLNDALIQDKDIPPARIKKKKAVHEQMKRAEKILRDYEREKGYE